MTETPENSKENLRPALQSHEGGRRPDIEQHDPNPELYTESEGCDSVSDLDDAAEDFLHQSISEVWADIAKRKRSGRVSARRSDAALLRYIASYIAAHSDPQPFLRNLQTTITSPGSPLRKQEATDA